MSEKRHPLVDRGREVKNVDVPRLAQYRNADGSRIGMPAPPQVDFDSEILSNLPPIQHTGGRSGFFQFLADQGAAPELDDAPTDDGGWDQECGACKGSGSAPGGVPCQYCSGSGTYTVPPKDQWYDNQPENQVPDEAYRQMLTGRRRHASRGFVTIKNDRIVLSIDGKDYDITDEDFSDFGSVVSSYGGDPESINASSSIDFPEDSTDDPHVIQQCKMLRPDDWGSNITGRRRQAYKNPTYIPPAAEERFSVTDRYDDRGTPGRGDAMEDKYQHDPKRAAARGRADILIARAEQAARAGRPEMADRLIAEAEACMNGHNGIMARPVEAGRRVSAVQSHYDWSQEAQRDGRSARPCNAHDGNFGGSCFNCGYPGADALSAQEQQSGDSADDDATVESAFEGYDDAGATAPTPPKPPKAPKPPEGYAGRRKAGFNYNPGDKVIFEGGGGNEPATVVEQDPNDGGVKIRFEDGEEVWASDDQFHSVASRHKASWNEPYANVSTGYAAYGSGADDALDFGD